MNAHQRRIERRFQKRLGAQMKIFGEATTNYWARSMDELMFKLLRDF